MGKLRLLVLTGLVGVTGLTGCFSSVRRVEQVQTTTAPLQTASVSQLESQISARDAAIKTLNASVLITASTGGGKEGQVKTYTSFRGYIFVRKPRELRVILQLPDYRRRGPGYGERRTQLQDADSAVRTGRLWARMR